MMSKMDNLNRLLKSGERLDELHRNNYKIIQNTGKFCFGMDAVLLTGFAKVLSEETVIDLGTGTWYYTNSFGGQNQGSSLYRFRNTRRKCGYGQA